MKIDMITEDISQQDLEAIEKYADKLFAKVGIDVAFTRHFLDRANDERNKKPITAPELVRIFKQEYKRWAKPIAKMVQIGDAKGNHPSSSSLCPICIQFPSLSLV